MAVEVLVSLYVLAVLFSKSAADSHKDSPGLSCVNDFVNNVSCTWDASTGASGLDCWIVGMKITWIYKNQGRHEGTIIRNCKLKQHRNSPSGCSFVFENDEFNPLNTMPYIRVECNGTTVENITNYSPFDHIKMHPPGVPNVSCTANETLISWRPGGPPSIFLKFFDFQVQIKQKKQSWDESSTLFTQEQELMVDAWKVTGPCQVRVRVKPTLKKSSHWSDWSPTTSWQGATDMGPTTQDEEGVLGTLSMVRLVGGFCLCIFVIVALVLYRRLLKGRPVPTPSKYFHTLHSVHGGNVKEWLNPPSAPESFFTAQLCDSISPIEICGGLDVVPTTSSPSGSTSAMLHFRNHPPAGSDTSGVVADSSSSSSFFSNKGYFISSSSGSVATTGLSLAYLAYCNDSSNLRNTLNLRLSLHPSLNGHPTYESLKREPQSPDSGLGIGKEDEDGNEDGNEDERFANVEEKGVSDDEPSPALLILPLHLPSQMCPPSRAPPTPNAPTLTMIPSESQQVEVAVAAANGHYAAWPTAGAMCRSSSMPVEPCKTGYLTLKELQTTFSNKSI
ncbi:interleukin-2 receptor subunit beta isoform X2 [Pungitius pungitius]|uniref:interleukin-2 receptor subunit beta isoform X2 n=1 Tax=Pungitius pungitius TaxID=134920 RepID=UPI00188923A8